MAAVGRRRTSLSTRTARYETETAHPAVAFVDGHPTARTLEAYRAGELTRAEQEQIRRHLDWCRDCVPLLEGEAIFDRSFPVSKLTLRKDFEALEARLLAFPQVSRPAAGDLAGTIPPKIDRIVEEIVTQIELELRARMAALEASGRDPEALHSADELVRKMLSAVPEPSAWDELLGPFYRTRQLAEILGLSTSAVLRRRQRRSLLGLKTEDGVLVYPAFQLDLDNRLLAGLPATLCCFRDVPVDDWTLAGWFVTPHSALDGYSVLDALRSEGANERLMALARDTARRFDQ